MRKRKNQKPIYLDRDILHSPAYRTLKKVKSIPVLIDFLARRKMSHEGRGGKKKWICINNGEIIFTYNEAKKLGYSADQFMNAKRELVEHGFIDVNILGGLFDGDPAKFSISERWRKFGKDDFEFKTILKDDRKDRGWRARWNKLKAKKVRKKYRRTIF